MPIWIKNVYITSRLYKVALYKHYVYSNNPNMGLFVTAGNGLVKLQSFIKMQSKTNMKL